MTTRKTQSAQSFAAEAQRQFNELRSALKAARASLASINRSIRNENIKTPRHKIPKSTSGGLSFLDTLSAKIFGGFLSDEVGGSANVSTSTGNAKTTGNFPQSTSQLAGKLLDAAIRGQRIR